MCWTPAACPGRKAISLGSPATRAALRRGDAELATVPTAPALPRGLPARPLPSAGPDALQGHRWHPGPIPTQPVRPSHSALPGRTIAIASARTSTAQGTFEPHLKCPRGNLSPAHFPRGQAQGQQTPTTNAQPRPFALPPSPGAVNWETTTIGKAFP